MTTIREVQNDFGWLISEKDVKKAKLDKLYALRKQWPMEIGQTIPDTHEHLMVTLIDNTISLALTSLGFVSLPAENGSRDITFVHDERVKLVGLGVKLSVKMLKTLAGRKAVTNFTKRDKETAALHELVGADTPGHELVKLFTSPQDEIDPEFEEWYQELGYATITDWLHRTPWWAPDYTSEADADADYDAKK